MFNTADKLTAKIYGMMLKRIVSREVFMKTIGCSNPYCTIGCFMDTYDFVTGEGLRLTFISGDENFKRVFSGFKFVEPVGGCYPQIFPGIQEYIIDPFD
jgi:hypothetical protein